MSISRAMAEFALNESIIISQDTYKAAKKVILDTIGTAIAGFDSPGIKQIREILTEWGGKGEGQVLVYGDKLPLPSTVFLNSCMIHALDLDDLYRPAALHITSSVIPVAFGIGELMNSTGKEILDAVIIGIEVAARLGKEFVKRIKHDSLLPSDIEAGIDPSPREFLPSTIIGGFGATTTACRLLGLSIDETVNAFGIYYAQASGNRQALYDLTLTKRMQPAFGAKAAIWAAYIAKKGITGPEKAFEGDAGLFKVYARSGDIPSEDYLTQERASYEIERITFKRFPTCGASHPAILAALDCYAENRLKYEEIEKVEIYIDEGGNRMVKNPFDRNHTIPQIVAQFSAPYVVALALLRGHVTIHDITNEQIRKDIEVKELAEKVEIIKHWDYKPYNKGPNDNFPDDYYWPQMVRVTVKNGEVKTYTRWFKDFLDPELMSYQDVVDKFIHCARFSEICPEESIHSIINAVGDFESIKDIGSFIKEKLIFAQGGHNEYK